jgi:hypothetical protein
VITYAQIEAIHDAMRDLEALLNHPRADDIDVRASSSACIDTIRAALAGEVKEGE